MSCEGKKNWSIYNNAKNIDKPTETRHILLILQNPDYNLFDSCSYICLYASMHEVKGAHLGISSFNAIQFKYVNLENKSISGPIGAAFSRNLLECKLWNNIWSKEMISDLLSSNFRDISSVVWIRKLEK